MIFRFCKTWSAVAVLFFLLYAVYLLFVSTLDETELIAGLAAAAVSTLAAMVFRTGERVKFCPSGRDLIQAWPIPWYALQGSYELFKALLLQLLGVRKAGSVLRAVHFSSGGNNCRSSSRRVLAALYTTMTPNSIVLGITHQQKLLLLHQIVPGKVRGMAVKLGARP